MKLYRFSPIKSKKELFDAIRHVHFEGYKLCKQTFGYYLPNAGNMGVFCHYDNEYERLIKIRKELTEASENINQKYYRLLKPVTIKAQWGDIPTTTYTHLYIRKPDPYRFHVGDLDFYLEPKEYKDLKKSIMAGKNIKGARVFERPDLDMIELFDPDVDVLSYVSTVKMSSAVRVKLSDATKL